MTRAAVILSALFAFACVTPAELDDRWEDPEKIVFAIERDLVDEVTRHQDHSAEGAANLIESTAASQLASMQNTMNVRCW